MKRDPDRKVEGKQLRTLRVQVGVSLRELAELVGCSWRHVQMIETAGRQPSIELLHKFRLALATLHDREVHLDEFTIPSEPGEKASEKAAA